MADVDAVRNAILEAVRSDPGGEARFALVAMDSLHAEAVAASLRTDLAPFAAQVEQRSPDELLLVLKGFRIADETAAFRAADALVSSYALDAAEPEIFFTAMPVQPDVGQITEEGVSDWLGCWVGEEPGLANHWAIAAMHVPEAWAFAESRGRPSRGEGIVIAQPDTGITRHPELAGVMIVAQRNLIGASPNDATDPLTEAGNPSHGTATSSVLLSPESLDISGAAPLAKLMPIRAIDSVVRLSQIKVAEAIDYAVNNGAQIITMSLGGIASFTLWRALSRAVDAGVLVLAAAGNCVNVVVWPARYDKCIAVAGVNSKNQIWQGSCRGSAVDISAPAQNVYRAFAHKPAAPGQATTYDVAQGEGTSYAVALTAGVAACWLAFHGRANVIAAARQRGESAQDMFRRLLKATAHVPAGWDGFNLGAGVVDAVALLKADLDLGRGTEGPTESVVSDSPGRSVRSLAYEKLGSVVVDAELDWQKHGTEISLALLRRQSSAQPATANEATAVLETLVPTEKRPRATERPADERRPEAQELGDPLAAPALRRPRPEALVSERLKQQRRIIAVRAAIEEGSFLESTLTEEAVASQPLTRHGADATLDRVLSLAQKMPANEVRDKQAFVTALQLLSDHGGNALKTLVGEDPAAETQLNGSASAALEAIIIADGSRPSFLIENSLPPANHPFMGTWQDKVAKAMPLLKPICDAVGRIQPRYGHAGNFIGTGCLVDAAMGIVLTNFHVLDDARKKFGILMDEADGIVRIHGWMEIDFLGEATSFATRRFRVVEARLPPRAGRGFGHMDAVTLRIEQIDDAEMPQAIAFDGTAMVFNQVAARTFCTVGFPGPPEQNQGPKGEIDWNFVIRTLFGDLFGVKRLAPGRIGQINDIERDTLDVVFGHEATTFGGASGSALLAWENPASPAFGLHFSGATGRSNFAISSAKAAIELRGIGVAV
ncbi:S8 family serine peptidase [Mesorhizobium sp. M0633]|uniref:S8 family serine peptidase n=1 Tax=Mesorhizobium sp. M0633 TaxID=2956977 RepID=UPI003334AB83